MLNIDFCQSLQKNSYLKNDFFALTAAVAG